MNTKLVSRFRTFKFALALGVMLVALTGAASSASAFVTYNNIPFPPPGNLPSLGYEATSTSEFGGAVDPSGILRRASVVTVGMSSWGCEAGHWASTTDPCQTSRHAHEHVPITLNAYELNPDNSVGALIVSKTKTFDVPYRPSADPDCTGGRWMDRHGKCNNGKFFTITFPLIRERLPDKVIFTVAYNTSHYGASPIGTSPACYGTVAGCIYDSLNVAVTDPAAPPNKWAVGSAPLPDDVYLDSTWGGAYCDGGTGGTGSLRLDAGCWTGYQPVFNVISFLP